MPKPDYGIDQSSYVLTGRRAAPADKFRLLGADTYDGSDFAIDFDDKEKAIAFARKRTQDMLKFYLYDSAGELVFSC